MDKNYLIEYTNRIKEQDKTAMENSRKHWNDIAKPLYGLGLMEELVVNIAGVQGTSKVCVDKKAVIVMCADNGIVEEGVAQSNYSVTTAVAKNMVEGLASINHMAEYTHADVFTVDIGMKDDISVPNLIIKKKVNGTKNFLQEPAISEDVMVSAIISGIETVEELCKQSYNLIAVGEMGIGNTTTSSAIASVLLDMPVEEVTGRGAGLDDKGLIRKIEVIKQAIDKYKLSEEDVYKVIQTVGGLDICGIMGVYIGGAIYGIPVVMDGLITGVAALAVSSIFPKVKECILPSHMGKEPAMKYIMDRLDKKPVICGELALGEGTGGVMLFPLIDMAMKVYNENPNFEELNIDSYKDYVGKES